MPSSHLILSRPLFLPPPIPPSIRVFSNESTLHMRWPKYWSFSFSIIPSKEIPGLLRKYYINKASGGDGISAKLFKILKDESVKMLHGIFQQIQQTKQWPQDWKRSVFIPIPKKDNLKNCSYYCTISLISHSGEFMLKILQASLQQYMN